MEIIQENKQCKEGIDDEQRSDDDNHSKQSCGLDSLRSSIHSIDQQLTLRFEDLEDNYRDQQDCNNILLGEVATLMDNLRAGNLNENYTKIIQRQEGELKRLSKYIALRRGSQSVVQNKIVEMEIIDTEDGMDEFEESSDDFDDAQQICNFGISPNEMGSNTDDQELSVMRDSSQNWKTRVLVVDDEPFNVVGMQLSLSRLKIKGLSSLVDRAYNGLEALNKVKESYSKGSHTYGLIITDISMPVMDGYDSSREIRDFYEANQMKQPLIVACTGHVEEEFIQKAWFCGIDEILPKPVSIEVLTEISKEIIDNSYSNI